MVTAIYASILAMWICGLSFQVIKARRKNKVKYMDGGINELIIARSAHSNATEYIPIALILLFLLEYNTSYTWLIHIIGSIFCIGRIIHGRSMLQENLKGRVLGMQLTFTVLAALAVLNIIFVII